MKKTFAEFKKFISQGNVMNLAVAFLMGSAFTAITKSLADDIISPLLGIFGDMDFSDLTLKFRDGNVEIRYGAFLTSVIQFFIIAMVVFFFMKIVTKLLSGIKTEEKPHKQNCRFCCAEIPIEATRCPNCTSFLKNETQEQDK